MYKTVFLFVIWSVWVFFGWFDVPLKNWLVMYFSIKLINRQLQKIAPRKTAERLVVNSDNSKRVYQQFARKKVLRVHT